MLPSPHSSYPLFVFPDFQVLAASFQRLLSTSAVPVVAAVAVVAVAHPDFAPAALVFAAVADPDFAPACRLSYPDFAGLAAAVVAVAAAVVAVAAAK